MATEAIEHACLNMAGSVPDGRRPGTEQQWNGGSPWRHSHVERFAGTNLLNGGEQFLLDYSVVGYLVLGHMGDDYADLKLGKVLLELKAAVNRDKNVKLLLRDCQERSVLQSVPALLVNGGDFMIAEQQLDARVYALVNEDAHSRSWLLAKSSTVRTCSRVMGG